MTDAARKGDIKYSSSERKVRVGVVFARFQSHIEMPCHEAIWLRLNVITSNCTSHDH